MKKKASKADSIKVEIVFDPNKCVLEAGLRVNWVDGEDDTCEINLSCGAGVGSPYMVFSRRDKKSGETRWAVADVRPIISVLATEMKKLSTQPAQDRAGKE